MSATLATVQTAYSSPSLLAGQADFAAPAAMPARAAATDQATAGPAAGSSSDSTLVTLSPQARALQQQDAANNGAHPVSAADNGHQLQFPDAALMAQLRAAGIPEQPSFMLEVDPADHRVKVLGARPDAARIAAMINTTA